MVAEEDLHQLFGQLKLGNSNIKNYHNTLPKSQVLLFTTIRSSTNQLNDSTSVTLKEGVDRERCAEIGSSKVLKLIPLTNEAEENELC